MNANLEKYLNKEYDYLFLAANYDYGYAVSNQYVSNKRY